MSSDLAERFRAITREAAALQEAYAEAAAALTEAMHRGQEGGGAEAAHARLRDVLADYGALVAERKRLLVALQRRARDTREL